MDSSSFSNPHEHADGWLERAYDGTVRLSMFESNGHTLDALVLIAPALGTARQK